MRQYRAIPLDQPIETGEFVYGWLFKQNDKFYIYPKGAYSDLLVKKWSILVHPSTVGQATGLEETWGDDIICYPNDYPSSYGEPPQINNDIGEVYYNEERAAFYVRASKNAREKIDMPLDQVIEEYGPVEIIGTRHTHPALLEGGKK